MFQCGAAGTGRVNGGAHPVDFALECVCKFLSLVWVLWLTDQRFQNSLKA